ncbi:MAG: hypothetical protein ACOC7V_03435 [Spirochaetota bacterium]
MKSSSVDPTRSGRAFSGRGVSRAAAIIAGIAVLTASFVVMGISLAAVGRTDDQSGDLRRNILENAFYVTKIHVQLEAISEYEPTGSPDDVRREINRLRFPLSAHMGMYSRPEVQQAMLDEVLMRVVSVRKLRASATEMWNHYVDLRATRGV